MPAWPDTFRSSQDRGIAILELDDPRLWRTLLQ